MRALLLLLLFLGRLEEPIQEIQKTEIRSFKNGRLTLCIRANKISPEGKNRYKLEAPKATIYTTEKEPRVVQIRAKKGLYEEDKKLLHLKQNIEIKFDKEIIKSEEACIDIEKKLMSIEKNFSFSKPGLILRGFGLNANQKLNSLRVKRSGYLRIEGKVYEIIKDHKSPQSKEITIIKSKESMHIKEHPAGIYSIKIKNGANLQRKSLDYNISFQSKNAMIKIKEKKKEFELIGFKADSNINILDSAGLKASADVSYYDHFKGAFYLSGNPVKVHHKSIDLSTKMLILFQKEKKIICKNNVRTQLRTGLKIRADNMDIHLTEDVKREVKDLLATGNVAINKGDIEADCSYFKWNPSKEKGIIIDPSGAIIKGQNLLIRSPKVIICKQTFFVSNPGSLKILSKEADYLLEADYIELSPDVVRLHKNSSLYSSNIRIKAHNIRVYLKNKRIERILAISKLMIKFVKQGYQVSGELLNYYPDSRRIIIKGDPFALLEGSHAIICSNIIVFDGKTGDINAMGIKDQSTMILR